MIYFTAHLANKRRFHILTRSQHASSTCCKLQTYWHTAYLGSKKARRSASVEMALEKAVPVATWPSQDRSIFWLLNIVSIHKRRDFCIPVLASEREARYQSGSLRHVWRISIVLQPVWIHSLTTTWFHFDYIKASAPSNRTKGVLIEGWPLNEAPLPQLGGKVS